MQTLKFLGQAHLWSVVSRVLEGPEVSNNHCIIMNHDCLYFPVFMIMTCLVISILWCIQIQFLLLECRDLFSMFNIKNKNCKEGWCLQLLLFHFFFYNRVKLGKDSILALGPQWLFRARDSCQKDIKVLQAHGRSFEKVEHLKVALTLHFMTG